MSFLERLPRILLRIFQNFFKYLFFHFFMKINGFEFDVGEFQLRRLARKLEGSPTKGSVFCRSVFPTPESLVEFAFEHLGNYQGRKMIVIRDLPHTVGYEGIVELSDPRMEGVPKELGWTRWGTMVWTVRSLEKLPTNRLVIIAGPKKRGRRSNHTIYTIHPGMVTPYRSDFDYGYFWRTHALIDN